MPQRPRPSGRAGFCPRSADRAVCLDEKVGAYFAETKRVQGMAIRPVGRRAPVVMKVQDRVRVFRPDLREALVYWTVHGDPEVRKHTARGLENARGYLRHEIGFDLKLRVTPDLHFTYDEAIDRGERIEQLIRQVHDEDKGR